MITDTSIVFGGITILKGQTHKLGIVLNKLNQNI